jgi:hypothetical protein
MRTVSILAASLAIALPTIASAHDASPLYRELARQRSLIEDGRRSGDLTFQELTTLQGEQNDIRYMLMDAQYDGSFTSPEYRKVESALWTAARNIRNERNNDHVAYWRIRGSGSSGQDELGYPRELSRDGQGPANGWNNGWGRRWGWGNRWGYGRQSWYSN